MNDIQPPASTAFPFADKALLALCEAVREVVAQAKKSGAPLVVWQDGQVKWVPADELPDLPVSPAPHSAELPTLDAEAPHRTK